MWVLVWANIRSFRGDSAFSTWLYRIATNTCLGFGKRESRREQHERVEVPSYLPEQSGGEEADPGVVALNSELQGGTRAALRNVRAEHRAALVLRHMEGRSCMEIAKALNIPDGTAKGWASRGRVEPLTVLAQEGRVFPFEGCNGSIVCATS